MSRTIAQRVYDAESGLKSYLAISGKSDDGDSPRTQIIDLIADLLHLAATYIDDEEDIAEDISQMLYMASVHFTEEHDADEHDEEKGGN